MEHEMKSGFLYRVLWGYNVPRLFFAMGLGFLGNFVCVYTWWPVWASFRKSTPEGGNPAALRIPRP